MSTETLAGRVSLVNVWGTWCVECRHEHAFLVELARAGVPIYGLNVKDDRAAAIDWLARLGNPYVSSGFDPEGKAAIDWGVTGAPETFLIGSDGTILHKHISPLTPRVWQRDFLPLLREHCGASRLPVPGGGRRRHEEARLACWSVWLRVRARRFGGRRGGSIRRSRA